MKPENYQKPCLRVMKEESADLHLLQNTQPGNLFGEHD